MHPRKRYGQHFLVDGNILRKIVSAAGIRKGEDVLEIGPGQGALTGALLDAGARVAAIEIDRELCAGLRERFAGLEALEIINADALNVSFAGLALGRRGRLKVVANLPYNISGPVLIKFMEERESLSDIVVMLQKEVAERIAARPGTKDYGAITVRVQAYAAVRRVFSVSPNSFRPVPRVASMVVRITPLDRAAITPEEAGFFRLVVTAAFGQRRKTLANALKTLRMPQSRIDESLVASGIDPQRRGETLNVEEFARLARSLGA